MITLTADILRLQRRGAHRRLTPPLPHTLPVDVVELIKEVLGESPGLCSVHEFDTWKAKVTLQGTDQGGGAGSSVSYSADGTRVALGAPGNDDAFVDAGQVQVFGYDSASKQWAQLGHNITGGAADDRLGTSVSMSADGSRVAIGAPGRGAGSWGYVRVLEYDESGNQDWNKIGHDLRGVAAGDQAGTSVSISADGTRVAIGAPGNDGNGTNAGHVRVFEHSSSSGWQQLRFRIPFLRPFGFPL